MRKGYAGLALLATVYFLGGSVAAAEPYNILRLKGQLVRWVKPALNTTTTITYSFAQNLSSVPEARNCKQIAPIDNLLKRSGISLTQYRREAKAAFAMWQQVANLRFIEVANDDEADIVIGAQLIPRGHAFTNVEPDRSAHSHRSFDAIKQARICLNPQKSWKVGFDGDLDVYDLRYTLAHEIGHTLGLDHPSVSGQLMSFRYGEAFRQPQFGDILGAVALYGPPTSSVTPGVPDIVVKTASPTPAATDKKKTILGIE